MLVGNPAVARLTLMVAAARAAALNENPVNARVIDCGA
jgi:hypothetical protein